ncbi:uncharacterized protein EDB91DRAFT_1336224, partial [Suillus paluster]|uniref:uncharacterized protein n=1 Tax=Suillus paluster TaxID=48578 RepID=UPI001B86B5DB
MSYPGLDDIIRCALTCRTMSTTVKNSVELQYAIEPGAQGLVQAHHGQLLSPSSHQTTCAHSESRWTRGVPSSSMWRKDLIMTADIWQTSNSKYRVNLAHSCDWWRCRTH